MSGTDRRTGELSPRRIMTPGTLSESSVAGSYDQKGSL